MADFVTHGAVGAGAETALVEALGGPRWLKVLATVHGGLSGMWPDVGDWLWATLGWTPRWELYSYYHHTWDWWWVINPGFFLHTKVTDPPFHIIPGWNWWPTFASIEISWVMVAIGLLWYAWGLAYTRPYS